VISIEVDKNNTYGILKSNLLDIIRERFSVANPTYGKTKFSNKFMPRRLYALTLGGRFDIGLYGEIIKFCKQEGYIIENSTILSLYKPVFVDVLIKPLNLSLRDYQQESIDAAIAQGRGVIVLPTGAGKTLTIATLINSIQYVHSNYNFLIIVPTIQLIQQTYNDFIEYGVNSEIISKWSGDCSPDFNCKIIVAGMQILQSQYNKYSDILNNIDVLIIDECHKLRKKNEFNNTIKYIKTLHRYGFTGTMPSELLDQWNIIGKIGPIIYEKQSITLRDNKQIANIQIQILIFNYINKPVLAAPNSFLPTKAFDEEITFLNNSSERNNKLAILCKNTDKNTLIVVERIAHGELLYDILQKICSNKKVFFIQGSIDVATRESIRALMEEEHNIVCIAISKIFAEGINIKNLHYIIFAASGKAKIKILQTIGRGVRLHPLKNMLYIFDIADNLRYSSKHLKERIKLYDTEKIPYKTSEIQI